MAMSSPALDFGLVGMGSSSGRGKVSQDVARFAREISDERGPGSTSTTSTTTPQQLPQQRQQRGSGINIGSPSMSRNDASFDSLPQGTPLRRNDMAMWKIVAQRRAVEGVVGQAGKFANIRAAIKRKNSDLMRRLKMNFESAELSQNLTDLENLPNSKDARYTQVRTAMRNQLARFGIVCDVAANDEQSGDLDTTYRLQGNLDMYSKENQQRRGQIKRHQSVREVLDDWWHFMPKLPYTSSDGSIQCIDHDIYSWMAQKLFDLFVPNSSDEEMKLCIDQDWKNDSKNRPILDKVMFCDAMFHFADIWAETTRVHEYVELLQLCVKTIREGPRYARSDAATKEWNDVQPGLAPNVPVENEFELPSPQQLPASNLPVIPGAGRGSPVVGISVPEVPKDGRDAVGRPGRSGAGGRGGPGDAAGGYVSPGPTGGGNPTPPPRRGGPERDAPSTGGRDAQGSAGSGKDRGATNDPSSGRGAKPLAGGRSNTGPGGSDGAAAARGRRGSADRSSRTGGDRDGGDKAARDRDGGRGARDGAGADGSDARGRRGSRDGSGRDGADTAGRDRNTRDGRSRDGGDRDGRGGRGDRDGRGSRDGADGAGRDPDGRDGGDRGRDGRDRDGAGSRDGADGAGRGRDGRDRDGRDGGDRSRDRDGRDGGRSGAVSDRDRDGRNRNDADRDREGKDRGGRGGTGGGSDRDGRDRDGRDRGTGGRVGSDRDRDRDRGRDDGRDGGGDRDGADTAGRDRDGRDRGGRDGGDRGGRDGGDRGGRDGDDRARDRGGDGRGGRDGADGDRNRGGRGRDGGRDRDRDRDGHSGGDGGSASNVERQSSRGRADRGGRGERDDGGDTDRDRDGRGGTDDGRGRRDGGGARERAARDAGRGGRERGANDGEGPRTGPRGDRRRLSSQGGMGERRASGTDDRGRRGSNEDRAPMKFGIDPYNSSGRSEHMSDGREDVRTPRGSSRGGSRGGDGSTSPPAQRTVGSRDGRRGSDSRSPGGEPLRRRVSREDREQSGRNISSRDGRRGTSPNGGEQGRRREGGEGRGRDGGHDRDRDGDGRPGPRDLARESSGHGGGRDNSGRHGGNGPDAGRGRAHGGDRSGGGDGERDGRGASDGGDDGRRSDNDRERGVASREGSRQGGRRGQDGDGSEWEPGAHDPDGGVGDGIKQGKWRADSERAARDDDRPDHYYEDRNGIGSRGGGVGWEKSGGREQRDPQGQGGHDYDDRDRDGPSRDKRQGRGGGRASADAADHDYDDRDGGRRQGRDGDSGRGGNDRGGGDGRDYDDRDRDRNGGDGKHGRGANGRANGGGERAYDDRDRDARQGDGGRDRGGNGRDGGKGRDYDDRDRNRDRDGRDARDRDRADRDANGRGYNERDRDEDGRGANKGRDRTTRDGDDRNYNERDRDRQGRDTDGRNGGRVPADRGDRDHDDRDRDRHARDRQQGRGGGRGPADAADRDYDERDRDRDAARRQGRDFQRGRAGDDRDEYGYEPDNRDGERRGRDGGGQWRSGGRPPTDDPGYEYDDREPSRDRERGQGRGFQHGQGGLDRNGDAAYEPDDRDRERKTRDAFHGRGANGRPPADGGAYDYDDRDRDRDGRQVRQGGGRRAAPDGLPPRAGGGRQGGQGGQGRGGKDRPGPIDGSGLDNTAGGLPEGPASPTAYIDPDVVRKIQKAGAAGEGGGAGLRTEEDEIDAGINDINEQIDDEEEARAAEEQEDELEHLERCEEQEIEDAKRLDEEHFGQLRDMLEEERDDLVADLEICDNDDDRKEIEERLAEVDDMLSGAAADHKARVADYRTREKAGLQQRVEREKARDEDDAFEDGAADHAALLNEVNKYIKGGTGDPEHGGRDGGRGRRQGRRPSAGAVEKARRDRDGAISDVLERRRKFNDVVRGHHEKHVSALKAAAARREKQTARRVERLRKKAPPDDPVFKADLRKLIDDEDAKGQDQGDVEKYRIREAERRAADRHALARNALGRDEARVARMRQAAAKQDRARKQRKAADAAPDSPRSDDSYAADESLKTVDYNADAFEVPAWGAVVGRLERARKRNDKRLKKRLQELDAEDDEEHEMLAASVNRAHEHRKQALRDKMQILDRAHARAEGAERRKEVKAMIDAVRQQEEGADAAMKHELAEVNKRRYEAMQQRKARDEFFVRAGRQAEREQRALRAARDAAAAHDAATERIGAERDDLGRFREIYARQGEGRFAHGGDGSNLPLSVHSPDPFGSGAKGGTFGRGMRFGMGGEQYQSDWDGLPTYNDAKTARQMVRISQQRGDRAWELYLEELEEYRARRHEERMRNLDRVEKEQQERDWQWREWYRQQRLQNIAAEKARLQRLRDLADKQAEWRANLERRLQARALQEELQRKRVKEAHERKQRRAQSVILARRQKEQMIRDGRALERERREKAREARRHAEELEQAKKRQEYTKFRIQQFVAKRAELTKQAGAAAAAKGAAAKKPKPPLSSSQKAQANRTAADMKGTAEEQAEAAEATMVFDLAVEMQLAKEERENIERVRQQREEERAQMAQMRRMQHGEIIDLLYQRIDALVNGRLSRPGTQDTARGQTRAEHDLRDQFMAAERRRRNDLREQLYHQRAQRTRMMRERIEAQRRAAATRRALLMERHALQRDWLHSLSKYPPVYIGVADSEWYDPESAMIVRGSEIRLGSPGSGSRATKGAGLMASGQPVPKPTPITDMGFQPFTIRSYGGRRGQQLAAVGTQTTAVDGQAMDATVVGLNGTLADDPRELDNTASRMNATMFAERKAEYIRAQFSLRDVYLCECKRHSVRPNQGLLKACPAEALNFTLVELDLNCNYLSSIVPFIDVILMAKDSLKRLYVKDNGLHNVDMKLLCQALVEHQHLSELDVSGNKNLTLAAGKSLLELVKVRKNIDHVRIARTSIPSYVVKQIQGMLEWNRDGRDITTQQVRVAERIFDEVDQDGDQLLSPAEIEQYERRSQHAARKKFNSAMDHKENLLVQRIERLLSSREVLARVHNPTRGVTFVEYLARVFPRCDRTKIMQAAAKCKGSSPRAGAGPTSQLPDIKGAADAPSQEQEPVEQPCSEEILEFFNAYAENGALSLERLAFGLGEPNLDRLRPIFITYDTDGDFVLTIDEFVNFMNSI